MSYPLFGRRHAIVRRRASNGSGATAASHSAASPSLALPLALVLLVGGAVKGRKEELANVKWGREEEEGRKRRPKGNKEGRERPPREPQCLWKVSNCVRCYPLLKEKLQPYSFELEVLSM